MNGAKITYPFQTVLIANRGECAVRLIRTCRRLGLRTVAVYSEADAGAPHVQAADEAALIGPPPAAASYLNIPRLLEVALERGAQAVLPGWGFLAENATFAEACAEAGLIFVGPSPEVMRLMGDKSRARQVAQEAGVPVVPGTPEEVSDAEAAEAAAELGYPVVLKASAGGGGIGLAVVHSPEQLPAALQAARGRAARAFGHDGLYVERFIAGARHVEIQLVADAHGAVIAFPERECSIQRRYQKVLEETPSPAVAPSTRHALQEAACHLARAIGYVNVGTVEFLLAPDGAFFFLEMNTRLQVEHGITELITGLDLVELSLRVAAGEPLPFEGDPPWQGHALEARIYAEDPETFLPAPGRVTRVEFPQEAGIRVDSGLAPGVVVSPFYDPLVAKVMAWGETREAAIERLGAALARSVVEGIKTNIPMHVWVLEHPEFRAGRYDIGWLERMG